MRTAKLLIVDDEKAQRDLLAGYLQKQGFEITTAADGIEGLAAYRLLFCPVALVDMKMPGMSGLELLGKLRELNPFVQVIVLTAFGSVETAVAVMRAGAFDYLTKPIEDLNELVVKLRRAADQYQLVSEHAAMSERLAEIDPTSELIGNSPAMRRVKELIGRVAEKDATVLVTGESGTGKELVARSIHSLSERRDANLVAINCSAFPETLLESELFGHEKGAFTGADRAKPGRVELADGGTLFLDEIGDMPLSMQVKLLRVIEERRVMRLGATVEKTLDIRIVAATNRHLEEAVKEGRFREDLYYRLNVVRIELPPLRERTGDILLLADLFIARLNKKLGKTIAGLAPEAAGLLTGYHWPGNVRELQNVLERAVVLARSSVIEASDLSGLNRGTAPRPSATMSLAEVEKQHIAACLDANDWNLAVTAETLGIHRNTLRAKVKEYGLGRSRQ